MAGGGRTGAWSARTNAKSQWIQVDFEKMKRVTQIASQGRSDYAQWVTRYRVSYSTFGKTFKSNDHVSYIKKTSCNIMSYSDTMESFQSDFNRSLNIILILGN